jgi:hypothetical protein
MDTPTPDIDWWNVIGWTAAVAGAGLGAYHGYRRNGDSEGWGALWGAFGLTLPFIAVPVALVQGFAEPSDSERIKRIEAGLRPDIAARLNTHLAE